jgi:CRP-like cAMP-binding protein
MPTWVRDETKSLLDLLAPSSTARQSVARSDVLFEQGVAVRHLYYVLEGSFKLVHHTREGKELIVELSGPGDVLGSFLEPQESTALARALEDAVVLLVPVAVLRADLEKSPVLAVELVLRAERKRRAAEAQAARLAFESVTRRLGTFLLEISDRKTGLLRFPLSQGEIASRIGSSRETVCSLLNELRRTGLVEIGRGQIRVLDRDRLTHVG